MPTITSQSADKYETQDCGPETPDMPATFFLHDSCLRLLQRPWVASLIPGHSGAPSSQDEI